MKSQSIAYLLSGSERIHDCGLDNLRDCKDNFFWSWVGRATFFGRVHRSFCGVARELWVAGPGPGLILLGDPFLMKLIGGASTSGLNNCGMKSSSIHDASQPQTHRAHLVIYIYDLSQLEPLAGVKIYSTYWWGGEGWKRWL